jgi:hypothetical protein
VLDGSAMELFEENSVVPSFFDWRDLVGWLLGNVLGVYSSGDLHYLQRIGLEEEGEGISTDLLASKFFTSHHTMRSGF